MAAIKQGFLSEIQPDVESLDNMSLQLTGSDSLKASWELANLDTAVYSIARNLDLKNLANATQDQPKLHPDELNKQFPDIPEKFKEPVNMAVANQIYTNQKQRKELQDKVNAGPQTGFYGFANKWGANLLAHATDPLELAAGFVVSAAVPVLAGSSIATKLGYNAGKQILAQTAEGLAVQTIPKATVGQAVARTFIEGTLQNLPTVGLEAYNSKQEQRDYEVTQSLMGAVGAAAGFSVLHGAVKLGGIKLNNFLARVGEQHLESIQRPAIAQLVEGKKLNVEPIMKELISDTNYDKKGFNKIPNEQIGEATFYSPKESVTHDISSKTSVISDDYGNGIYFTDDQKVANGAAARKLSENDGSILSGKIKDANLLDLDQPINPELMSFGKESGLKVKENMNGKDFFNMVHEGIESGKLPADYLDQLQLKAKEQGIDGYRFTVNELAGQPHAEHNAVMLFDKEKFLHEDSFLPDSNSVPRINQNDVQAHFERNNAPDASIHYEADSYNEYNKIKDSPPEEIKFSEVKKQVENLHEDLKSQIEQLAGTPEAEELAKIQERIKIDAEKSDHVGTILKAAKDCLVG